MNDAQKAAAPEPAWQAWHDAEATIRVGMSSCLFGQEVRFDGGHKHDRYLTDVLGYLKGALEPAEKQELIALIEDYRNGLVPLVVPVTLLRHHVRRHDVGYMLGQLYLEPHPKELMLRNRV